MSHPRLGLVTVAGHIGLREDSLREVGFLVDPGSFYTFLPPRLASDLGITTPVASRVVLADSRSAEVGVGAAYLRLMDRDGGILVALMDVPMPLLGASALEVVGFKVDPVSETLEHSRPFGATAL